MRTKSQLGKYSRNKGASYERDIARKLSKLTGQTWRRTPQSGANCIAGDVHRLSPSSFPYTIELKNREDIKLDKIFRNPSSIWEFLSDKQILIFNNRGQDFVVIPEETFPLVRKVPPYIVAYIFYPNEDYRIIDLKEFAESIVEAKI